jgi:hypothetical protein
MQRLGINVSGMVTSNQFTIYILSPNYGIAGYIVRYRV